MLSRSNPGEVDSRKINLASAWDGAVVKRHLYVGQTAKEICLPTEDEASLRGACPHWGVCMRVCMCVYFPAGSWLRSPCSRLRWGRGLYLSLGLTRDPP